MVTLADIHQTLERIAGLLEARNALTWADRQAQIEATHLACSQDRSPSGASQPRTPRNLIEARFGREVLQFMDRNDLTVYWRSRMRRRIKRDRQLIRQLTRSNRRNPEAAHEA